MRIAALKGKVTEKDLSGTPSCQELFPFEGEVSNHQEIFDQPSEKVHPNLYCTIQFTENGRIPPLLKSRGGIRPFESFEL